MDNKIIQFFKEYRWTLTCALIALVFVILVFTINFWRTLLLAAIVGAGIIIGLALDKKGSVARFFGRKED